MWIYYQHVTCLPFQYIAVFLWLLIFLLISSSGNYFLENWDFFLKLLPRPTKVFLIFEADFLIPFQIITKGKCVSGYLCCVFSPFVSRLKRALAWEAVLLLYPYVDTQVYPHAHVRLHAHTHTDTPEMPCWDVWFEWERLPVRLGQAGQEI